MLVCWEGAELDYLPAPGNSLVVSGNRINVQELKFSIASWGQEWCEEFSFRERVCGNLGDKERPVKSGPDFGSFWGRRQWQSPEGWTTFPHASLANYANETLSWWKRDPAALSSGHKSAQSFVPFFFPLLFTHRPFHVLELWPTFNFQLSTM